MAARRFSLDLARTYHLDFLFNFHVQDLFIEYYLAVFRFFLLLDVENFFGLLHLLQLSYTCHVKDLTCVANSAILIPETPELVIHFTLVSLTARTR